MLFELFSTGDRSDFTVSCQGHDFKVHKLVICPSSNFFKAVCTGKLKLLVKLSVDLNCADQLFQEQDSVELKETSPFTSAVESV